MTNDYHMCTSSLSFSVSFALSVNANLNSIFIDIFFYGLMTSMCSVFCFIVSPVSMLHNLQFTVSPIVFSHDEYSLNAIQALYYSHVALNNVATCHVTTYFICMNHERLSQLHLLLISQKLRWNDRNGINYIYDKRFGAWCQSLSYKNSLII